MHLNYFDVTVPVFIRNLTQVKVILEKGFADAKEKGMSEEAFLNQTLTSDMYGLKKQVQIATDNAKGAAARLAGVEPMKIDDTENTVAEIVARIDAVIAHLREFKAEQFESAADAKVMLSFIPGQYQTGKDYLVNFALPNFFFHVSMVYALVRAQGTSLGKADYIGSLVLHPVS
jgi:uncharacterized protein